MSYVGRGHAAGQLLSWDTAGGGCYRWLPASAPAAAGQILSWNGSAPAWITAPSGFTAGGDLSGTSTSQTVIRIQNRAVASTAPADGQVLTWDAGLSQWYPATPGGGGGATPAVYTTVALAEAATGVDNDLCYVVETDTWYRYEETEASTAFRDGKVLLNTGNGGGTRWVGIAGRFGNICNSRMPIVTSQGGDPATRTFLGKDALAQATTASNCAGNVALGFEAGMNLWGASNTLVGALAGRSMLSTGACIAIGYNAASNVQDSSYNIWIGINAGAGLVTVPSNESRNVAIGMSAGYNLTGQDGIYIGTEAGYGAGGGVGNGSDNIGIGYRSLYNGPSNLGAGVTGSQNVCVGAYTGQSITGGYENVLLGTYAGKDLTTGGENLGMGMDTLSGIVTGKWNIGIGDTALSGSADPNRSHAVGIGSHAGGHGGDHSIYIGYYSGWNTGQAPYNIAIGRQALMGGTSVPLTGSHNIAIGDEAASNLIGAASDNTVIGHFAGFGLSDGTDNILVGVNAGYSLASSSHNVAIGNGSLYSATQATLTAAHNVTLGTNSGRDITSGKYNTCAGNESGRGIVTGDRNTCLGNMARVDAAAATGRTAVGYNAVSLTDNDVRLGEFGTTTVHGGTYITDSDVRFKTAIEDCDLGLAFVCSLTPRKYQMKAPGYDEMSPEAQTEAQAKQGINHGFVAQEVKALLESLGVESNIHDLQESRDGFNPQAINYAAMVAPLVKAVQELSSMVDDLQADVAELERGTE